MGYGLVSATFLVMALADIEVLIALRFLPVPLIDFMGGIRLTESEALMRNVACSVCQFAGFSLPVWLIGAVVVSKKYRPNWRDSQRVRPERSPGHRGIGILAWTSLAIWLFILPFTQPEQQLRRRVERDLQDGRIAQALAEMSAHSPEDFPPHWDPPPSGGRHDQPPDRVEVLKLMIQTPPAPWVRAIYLAKIGNYLRYPWIAEEELTYIAGLLEQLPEGTDLMEELSREDHWRGRWFEEYLEKTDPALRGERSTR